MDVHGACHCLAVTYQAWVDPEQVVICHCTDCEANSAAAFRVVVPVSARSFHQFGLPRTYVRKAASGGSIASAFCAECGVALYTYRFDDPRSLMLSIGAVKERSDLRSEQDGHCKASMSAVATAAGGDDPRYAAVVLCPEAQGLGPASDAKSEESEVLLAISDLLNALWFEATGSNLHPSSAGHSSNNPAK